MEQRRLGRTGHLSSVVAFGAAALSRVDQATADVAIETALAAGVNHIDVAPSYGEAEERLAPWLAHVRDRVFLGCKTRDRTKAAAWASIESSIQRLGVERFDLFQLHGVSKLADLDEATAPGGAIEALVEARARGLTRFLGITGHTHDAPSTHLEALRRFDFDTVMLPCNFLLWSDAAFRRDFEALLDECQRRDVGVHIIKSAARAPWEEREHHAATWYEPFTEQEHLDAAIAFVLSLPITTLCSTGDVHILPRVIGAADKARGFTGAHEAVLAGAENYRTPFVGRWA